jgi:hypothetical protein
MQILVVTVRTGRPNRRKSQRREQMFFECLAAGQTPREAGLTARIDTWSAFGLATHPEFWLRISAARQSGIEWTPSRVWCPPAHRPESGRGSS